MPFQVNITSITGTPLFNIWVCDTSGATNTCVFIKSTNSNSTTFELPQEFETTSQYCVKIIDSFQCESYKCFD